MSRSTHKSVVLSIDSLAGGGDGVGRVDGKVCFVPYAAPGDRLKVRVVRENQSTLRAEIEEILEPGEGRHEPLCSHFGRCGGCQFLHLGDEVQQEAKRQILNRALGLSDVQISASTATLGYRRSARLHFENSRRDGAVLGFKKAGGQELIAIASCPILAPELSQCLPALASRLAETGVKRLEVRLALGISGAHASFSSDEPLAPAAYGRLGALVPQLLAGAVLEVQGLRSVLAGKGDVVALAADGKTLASPVGSFAQANTAVNQALGKQVSAWALEKSPRRAIELFAGAGNLTVCLAPATRALLSVEADPDAVRAARANLRERGYGHVSVEAKEALDAYRHAGPDTELVVLDPPRTGHLDLAKVMASSRHPSILYISCNPATLARDLAPLRAAGYEIQAAKGFDMFPQTAHIEAAVLLSMRAKERGR